MLKKYEFIRYGFSLVWHLVLILIRAILEQSIDEKKKLECLLLICTYTNAKYRPKMFSYALLSWGGSIVICKAVGLFKCIVKKKQSKISHFSFCNPTTSVFVIFCESVSLIQQLWKKSITCDQKAWVGRRYNGIFDSSEVVDVVKIWLFTKYN